jgi:hypothetical protein
MDWEVLKEEFILHPLIHTVLKFNLPQDIESIKSRAEDSAFS